MDAKSIFLGLLALIAFDPAHATFPGVTVSPEWLQANGSKVVILDVRSDLDAFTRAPEYETDAATGKKKLVELGGHIAGARLVDFGKIRVDRMVEGKKIGKMLPSAEQVTALIDKLGVNADDALVITSQGESSDDMDMAARLYWTLKVYGNRNMALLDGGNAAWVAAANPVSVEPMGTLPSGNWKAAALDDTWLAERTDIHLGDAGQTLIDARPAPQFLGIFYKKPVVAQPGHLQGAVNFAPDVRLRPVGNSQRFMSPVEYRSVLESVNVKPENGSIVYCNTGHMAAGAWFVLSEIMGFKGTRLYDGSMHEWTTLGRPTVSVFKP